MRDFVIKRCRPCGQFRIGQQDDGRVKLVYEVEHPLDPRRWQMVNSIVLEDDDLIGYLRAAGVKT